MKAINKKRRQTIQSIALARQNNKAGKGKERGVRVLRKTSKKSPIQALKSDEKAHVLEAQSRDLEDGNVKEESSKEKNRLLSKVKRRKRRSCASCWGN